MNGNAGQTLWVKAKGIIPGGNMLLSKRSEMFLPGYWPNYFSSAKGINVTDLDGRTFKDFSIMGIGTNPLGYGRQEVDDAVLSTVAKGNMSSLNCPEEVYLAEELIRIHPWAEMARFARTGGEANAIAIRIARAASGKSGIAVCGYHGWHDWYLASNLTDNANLDGHLLPGLEPSGVPKELAGSISTFVYNDYVALEKIVSNNPDLGVIKMEVARNSDPAPGFLEAVRELATANGIVLIFDECTSGFRETFGGIHKKYGVEPDMAVFGKALGNGYAITGVIGTRAVMESAQSTFISSTFWSERIGPSAALRVLEVMEREQTWERLSALGNYLRDGWKSVGEDAGVDISISGIPAISSFSVGSPASGLKYKTLITQEMLLRGYLATPLVFMSTAHDEAEIDCYLNHLRDIFELIARCEKCELVVDELLRGEVCHSGFKRLN